MKTILAFLSLLVSSCSHVNAKGLNAEFTVQNMVHQPMLINGRPADPSEWPASVYARMDNAACSATLIGERTLLIAAHCIENREKLSFSAHANNYTAVCDHQPEYDRGNATADWTLCLVNRPVTGVVFEELGVNEKLSIGQEVTLSGYGCVNPGGGSGNDGIFRIGIAKIEGLASSTNYDVVTKGGAALCFGDSGGAAYVVKGDKRVIFGVNSRGDIHTTSYLPAVSSKSFVNWAIGWAKNSNNVKICGLHSDAAFCRGGIITSLSDPNFEILSKAANIKGAVNNEFVNQKDEITKKLQTVLDSF